jgi:ornithine cyclodeaminase/alanine dehydrogenase
MDTTTLILSAADVRSLLSMEEAVRAVELAFAEHAAGRAMMPPKVYLSLGEYGGDFRAMPSYIGPSAPAATNGGGRAESLPAAAGVKWVNSHPDNPKRFGLPSVMGVYVLSDPATALPLAVLDATVLTAARTGAAAAVATKYLARPGFVRMGFVGSGVQARWMLAAHRAAFGDGFEVVASDVDRGAAEAFAREAGGRVASAEEAAGCDVVCTSTPGREVAVRRAWLRPGAHVNAMGADAPGKQELEASALADAIVVVDEPHQAVHSGEINVPVARGEYAEGRVFGTLGEVVSGRRRPSRGGGDVTIFDSTGLAVQDVALARVLYAAARARGAGTAVALVG